MDILNLIPLALSTILAIVGFLVSFLMKSLYNSVQGMERKLNDIHLALVKQATILENQREVLAEERENVKQLSSRVSVIEKLCVECKRNTE